MIRATLNPHPPQASPRIYATGTSSRVHAIIPLYAPHGRIKTAVHYCGAAARPASRGSMAITIQGPPRCAGDTAAKCEDNRERGGVGSGRSGDFRRADYRDTE